MKLLQQTDVKTLKQFWMRVSFVDGIKLGIGFTIGTAIASFVLGIIWIFIMLIFGIAFSPMRDAALEVMKHAV